MPKNAIAWFEIQTTDLDRAVAFYEAILDITMSRVNLGGDTAIFPAADDGAGGALIAPDVIHGGNAPSTTGNMIYLEVEGSLHAVLDRVPAAGGEVLLEPTDAGDYGAYAYIKDTEGNRVGLFKSA